MQLTALTSGDFSGNECEWEVGRRTNLHCDECTNQTVRNDFDSQSCRLAGRGVGSASAVAAVAAAAPRDSKS